MMEKIVSIVALAAVASGCDRSLSHKTQKYLTGFRPPAYPLITANPYLAFGLFRIRSMADRHAIGRGSPNRCKDLFESMENNAVLRAVHPNTKTIVPLAGKVRSVVGGLFMKRLQVKMDEKQ